MNNEGYIKVFRAELEDVFFSAEGVNRWQAWLYLRGEAAYKPRTFMIRGNKVELRPGDVAISQKRLAVRWEWGNKKVARFLKELEADGKIKITNTAAINIISICNWEKYTTDNTTNNTTDNTTYKKVKESKEEYKPTNVDMLSAEADNPRPGNIGQIDYNAIVELWHTKCPMLPRVKKMTDSRRRKIKTRWGELGDNPMQQLGQIFDKISSSNFCTGDNQRGWKATFDWVFENGDNWVKVIEGRYDNQPSTQTDRTAAPTTDTNGRPQRPSDRHEWSDRLNEWILPYQRIWQDDGRVFYENTKHITIEICGHSFDEIPYPDNFCCDWNEEQTAWVDPTTGQIFSKIG